MPHYPNFQEKFGLGPLTSLILIFSVISQSCGIRQISVCTYNLWNVMFSWEIRMRHISTLVHQAGCDVLLLQEVRLHGDRSWSQALFLQGLMPAFKWAAIRSANSVSTPLKSYWTGWEEEGLAVLSKLPVGHIWTERLSRAHGPDTNQRIALHVPIFVDSTTTVNVIVVHFSYHRQQQCQNALEILKYIHRNELKNVVIAGDFNIYPNFGHPVDLFVGNADHSGGNTNECLETIEGSLGSARPTFQDAWMSTQHEEYSTGYTFSNMPVPGLTSRPDRILASKDIRVMQTSLQGNGEAYKSRHSADILVHRLWRVLHTSKDTFQGHLGFSCLHDCGPHGSCRCGVCVRSEKSKKCELPDCEECSSGVFLQVCAFSFFLFLLFVLAVTAVIKILLVASRIDQGGAFFLCGYSCCLFNPRLLRQSTVTARHRIGRLLRLVGVGKLPPVFLLLVSLVMIGLCFAAGFVGFKSLLDTVVAVMAEEYFPSDHLMLVAQLEIS